MNWIKKFNELDKINTDKALDILSEYEKGREELLNDSYIKAYELMHTIDNTEIYKLTALDLSDEVIKWVDEYEIISKEYVQQLESIKKLFLKSCRKIVNIQENMLEETLECANSARDCDMIAKRLKVFHQKMYIMSISLDMHKLSDNTIFNDIAEELNCLRRFTHKRLKKEESKIEKDFQTRINSNKLKYNKIFNYKELCDIAEENNYKQVRVTGDHLIYKHSTSGKIVPIPANNELHYGIMRNIQKMIQVNCI